MTFYSSENVFQIEDFTKKEPAKDQHMFTHKRVDLHGI